MCRFFHSALRGVYATRVFNGFLFLHSVLYHGRLVQLIYFLGFGAVVWQRPCPTCGWVALTRLTCRLLNVLGQSSVVFAYTGKAKVLIG